MFNVVPRVNCVTYWLVTYTRMKRKDRPLIFMLKFLREKNHNFLQSTIENQQKGCYLVSWSTPGTLCLRTRRAPGTLYLSAWSTRGTHETLSEFLECFGHSIKGCLKCSRSSNKQYPERSWTSNNDLFADFQLLIVKNCDFFLRNFSIKMKGLSFLFVLV